jgi:hypothetical protein
MSADFVTISTSTNDFQNSIGKSVATNTIETSEHFEKLEIENMVNIHVFKYSFFRV